MKKREIKALIEEVLDDPRYINRAVEILHKEQERLNLPDLRKWFIDNGIPCLIRIDRGCLGVGDQRAHIRMPEITGAGLKASDPLFAWSCSYCHKKTESNPKLRLEHAEGVMRTLHVLTKYLPIVAKNDVTRVKSNRGMA